MTGMRLSSLAPFGALFLASGLALVTYILSGISLAWTFGVAVGLALATGTVLWRRTPPARRAGLVATVRAGMVAGVLATLAYDVARFALVRLTGMTFWPFDIFEIFGRALIGDGQPAGLTAAVGLTYHLVNGIGFATGYTVLLRRHSVVTGILWGLMLEALQLAFYPGWLQLRALGEFVQVSVFGHVVYGAVLGLVAGRALAGRASAGRRA
jgi:hypothetical protein